MDIDQTLAENTIAVRRTGAISLAAEQPNASKFGGDLLVRRVYRLRRHRSSSDRFCHSTRFIQLLNE